MKDQLGLPARSAYFELCKLVLVKLILKYCDVTLKLLAKNHSEIDWLKRLYINALKSAVCKLVTNIFAPMLTNTESYQHRLRSHLAIAQPLEPGKKETAPIF
ncbi:MAG: hypothetical protein V4732_18805 [Pseudomonadota bacterium]